MTDLDIAADRLADAVQRGETVAVFGDYDVDGATATALLAFNTGVEAAQLVVASLVLPLGFLLRNVRLYPLRLIPGASGVAAIVALAWFAQRTLGLPIRLF